MEHIILFTVKYPRDGFTVEYWPGYGITAPRIITSNGSAWMVAGQVTLELQRSGDFQILPGAIEPDCSSVDTLRDQLLAFGRARGWQ